MIDYHTPIFPGRLYHIYSRANGDEKLFREPEDYIRFLNKMKDYILPIGKISAFNLLPNHFHTIVRFNCQDQLIEFYKHLNGKDIRSVDLLPDFIMHQLSRLLNSHSKKINHKYFRRGSLFIDYARRVEIESLGQLFRTVYYVHNNAVRHGYCKNIIDWPWCSYKHYLQIKHSWLDREEVLNCYGGLIPFRVIHEQPADQKLVELEWM